MYKIILYYPYPLREAKSGSTVRPKKILKAFRKYTRENSIELIEIFGDSKERKRKIKRLILSTDPNKILYCYMENSTLPFWLTDKDHFPRNPFLEINFFRYLDKNDIPLGLFYRDIYWKFDDYPLKGMKRTVMRYVYRAEYLIYRKYVDHFFLPSIEMNKYVEFPPENTSSLPPAGENLIIKTSNSNSKKLNIIYVGGINENYGLIDMLDAVEKAYQKNVDLKLHIVCRREEFLSYKEEFNRIDIDKWLEVYHAYGDQLKKIYKIADIAIIPRKKNEYNDFSVPVKLFEYLSYGLPLIITDCDAQVKVVNKNNLGIVVKSGSEGIMEGINYFNDKINIDFHSKQVEKALNESHLWIHRIEKITKKLNIIPKDHNKE